TNSGTGALIQGGYYGVKLGAGGTITNSGTITATGTNGNIAGSYNAAIFVKGGGGTVTNSGSIMGASGSPAIRLDSGGRINNTGTITATTGIRLGQGGSVTNGIGGLINAPDSIDIGYSYRNGATTVINRGTITGGIGIRHGATGTNTIVNYGTMA